MEPYFSASISLLISRGDEAGVAAQFDDAAYRQQIVDRAQRHVDEHGEAAPSALLGDLAFDVYRAERQVCIEQAKNVNLERRVRQLELIAESGERYRGVYSADAQYKAGDVVRMGAGPDAEFWTALRATRGCCPGYAPDWEGALGANAAERAEREALQTQVKQLEARADHVLHFRGAWDANQVYIKGAAVTVGGALWVQKVATTRGDRPGTSDSWQIAVKRGRDGRPAQR